MSLPCGEVREKFEGYAGDWLTPAERREIRDHFASCGACFEAASAFDPTLLFSAAASPEVAPDEVARILSAVRTGIALKRSERRLSLPGPRPRRRRAAVVSAAAVVALTLLLPAGWRRPIEPLAPRTAVQPARAVRPSPDRVTIHWPEGAEGPRRIWIYGVDI